MVLPVSERLKDRVSGDAYDQRVAEVRARLDDDVAVGSEAAAGVYDVTVSQLARAHRVKVSTWQQLYHISRSVALSIDKREKPVSIRLCSSPNHVSGQTRQMLRLEV